MEQGGNPILALLGFWMFLQLAVSIVLILGGVYLLFCLGRAAAGLDRLASAMEEWVQWQKTSHGPAPDVYVPPIPPEPISAPAPPAEDSL